MIVKRENNNIKESLNNILIGLDEAKENTENIKQGISNLKTLSRVQCEKMKQQIAKNKNLNNGRSRS